MKNYAYVFWFDGKSPDLLPGIITLVRTLQNTGTHYPIYCLTVAEITFDIYEILINLSVNLIYLDPNELINFDETFMKKWPDARAYSKQSAKKLFVCGLTQFDKIVLLDTDLLIKQSIDSLFDYRHFSACLDKAPETAITIDDYKINSGVVVIEPSKDLDKKIIQAMFDYKEPLEEYEQTFLGIYCDWKNNNLLWLPYVYNVAALALDTITNNYEYNTHTIKIYHFSGPKPWNLTVDTLAAWRLNPRWVKYVEATKQYLAIVTKYVKEMSCILPNNETLGELVTKISGATTNE